ncbi:hypothetical protein E2977_19875 [Paracoccus yeei]
MAGGAAAAGRRGRSRAGGRPGRGAAVAADRPQRAGGGQRPGGGCGDVPQPDRPASPHQHGDAYGLCDRI